MTAAAIVSIGIVATRHRLVTPGGTIKCDREAAQKLALEIPGAMVDHSSVMLLTGGGEVLGAWETCTCDWVKPGEAPAPKPSPMARRCGNCDHPRGEHSISGRSFCEFEYSRNGSVLKCQCGSFEEK